MNSFRRIVRLVNNDEVPTRLFDGGAYLAILLQRVDRNDGAIELVEDVIVCRYLVTHPADGGTIQTRQWDRKPGPEIFLELAEHRTRCNNKDPVGPAPKNQLRRYQTRFQRLAESNVVRNQKSNSILRQGHLDWNLLERQIVDRSLPEGEWLRRCCGSRPKCGLKKQLRVHKARRTVCAHVHESGHRFHEGGHC